jgi:DNA-binding CsgD family transcriptional regulator
LFIAVALLGLIPETLPKKPDLSELIEIENLDIPIIEKLTPREKEIAVLLYKKLSNKEICELLCISNNTLKTHLRNLYHKAGVSNRKELRELFIEFLK